MRSAFSGRIKAKMTIMIKVMMIGKIVNGSFLKFIVELYTVVQIANSFLYKSQLVSNIQNVM